MNENYGNHIIQYAREYSVCTGCHSCEIMCALSHSEPAGPANGRIQIELDSVSSMVYTVMACQHCADHPCYEKCPKKDKAMCLDKDKNIAYINEENCIGCGLCVKACKFTPSRIKLVKVPDKKKRKAKKCDLCRNRPEGPICLEHCSAQCIGLSENPMPYQVNEKGEIVK